MRLLPFLTALIVAAVLYGLVIERERLLQFARDVSPFSDAAAAEPAEEEATAPVETQELAPGTVRVVARRSEAQIVDSAVILRGETEAVRQVEVRAETSGRVVSEPLRRGTQVQEGQLMCAIDPGTRDVSLQEAMARLAEAQSRLPESAARQAEAQAQIPAARARIAEAEAAVPAARAALSEARAGVPAAEARLREAQSRVPEAEARLAEAMARLKEAEARVPEAEARVPEAEARLAEAQAQIPAAEGRLAEALAQVPAAEASLLEAEARVPEAEARVLEAQARVREAEINLNAATRLADNGFASRTRRAGAEAAFESAKAGVASAQSQLKGAIAGIEAAKGRLEGAKAGVETARSGVESARAAVQAAQSQIQNAKAGLQAAQSQIESARAGIQSAESGVENALAGIESAQSQVEGARAAVQSATSGVEGAQAAVISAKAQLESAMAGIQSAASGEEGASAGVQSAEASVASAKKEIERLEMKAPFAGILETDTAELGTLLQPGSLCATILQLDPVKFVGFVPETEVDRIDLGARAGARLSSGREVTGEVSFVSRSGDPVTRTFRVEMLVANADLTIRDGQTAEIAIEAEGAPAHFLPQSALTLNDEGEIGVRTVVDNAALFRPVTILRDTARGIWVGGLPETVDVITIGQEYVTDGVPVAPTYAEADQ